MTKYCDDAVYGNNGYTDTLIILQPSDDAATKQWGNEWCTPTYTQWKELMEYCEYSRATVNGVLGSRYTASNGNSIFLPAAGSYEDARPINVGAAGNYWSKTLAGYSTFFSYDDGPHCRLAFHTYGELHFMESYYRFRGYTVRPVKVNR